MQPRTSSRRRSVGRWAAFVVFVAASTSVLAPSGAQAAESWQMAISGRGYGHGIGMSQYGAYGYALHGYTYKAILQHYYKGIAFGATTNRSVRVLLTAGQSSIGVSCPAAYSMVVNGAVVQLAAGTTVTTTWTGSALRLTSGTQTWTSAGSVVFRPVSSLLRLVNKNLLGLASTANAPYRGTVTVAHLSLGLSAINTLPLESYLRGVVPLEMPSSWALEALKAQAVAARTYAVRSIKSGAFDLYCDTRSQAYGGAGREVANTDTAVSATKGVTATYGGQPIAAFYFSTSGGYTENIENVWAASPLPYLKGVADPYDTLSRYHVWPDNPLLKPATLVAAKVGAASLPSGTLQTLYVVKRGVSKRVVSALAISNTGATLLSGSTLRTRLALRDTWFDVRSMSISPAGSTTVEAGQSLALSGTTYPALPADAQVVLHYLTGGSWASFTLPATAVTNGTRQVRAGTATYTCSFSTYRASVTPAEDTAYYFSYGTGQSPQTAVTVTVPTTALTLTAADLTPPYNSLVNLSGALRDPDRVPVAGAALTLERSLDGAAWSELAQLTTDAAGAFSFADPTAVTVRTYYRARFAGSDSLPAAGAVLRVVPEAALARPTAPSVVTVLAPFSVSGTLRPALPAYAKPLSLRCYRYESGRWVLRRTLTLASVDKGEYSLYSLRLSLPGRGSWRLIASFAGTPANSATLSSPRSVTVR